jgi:hypothetical protein
VEDDATEFKFRKLVLHMARHSSFCTFGNAPFSFAGAPFVVDVVRERFPASGE